MRSPLSRLRSLRRGALLAVLAVFATTLVAQAAASPGITVDDQAGALPSGAVNTIQGKAEPFVSRRIPVLVVIRKQATSASGVVSEAQGLLAQRALESRDGAKDGLVVLLDLDPVAGGTHGRGALAAGERLATALPGSKLSTIYSGSMVPLLRTGDITGAITAALQNSSDSLGGYQPAGANGTREGAPQAQSSGSGAGGIIVLLLILLLVGGGIGLAVALLRRRSGGGMPMGGYSGGPGYGGPGYGGPGYGGGGGIGTGGALGIGLGGAALGGVLGYELGRHEGGEGDGDRDGGDGGGGGGGGGGGDASSGSQGGGGGDWGGGGGGDFGGGGGGGDF